MNKSKLRSPQHWAKMRRAGGVETIAAAHDRANRSEPVAKPSMPTSVTVSEASYALGIHTSTVRRRLVRGMYKGWSDDNGKWVITDPDVIEAVVNSRAP